MTVSEIVGLSMLGWTVAEIARETGKTTRQVAEGRRVEFDEMGFEAHRQRHDRFELAESLRAFLGQSWRSKLPDKCLTLKPSRRTVEERKVYVFNAVTDPMSAWFEHRDWKSGSNLPEGRV